jgi:hypothetical protein
MFSTCVHFEGGKSNLNMAVVLLLFFAGQDQLGK